MRARLRSAVANTFAAFTPIMEHDEGEVPELVSDKSGEPSPPSNQSPEDTEMVDTLVEILPVSPFSSPADGFVPTIRGIMVDATPDKVQQGPMHIKMQSPSASSSGMSSTLEGSTSESGSEDALSEFHRFKDLPSEVRKTIWQLNLPGPRLVEVVVDENGRFRDSSIPIVNLQVCQESRNLALATYPLSFSVNYEDPFIPFNFETDTLLLSRRLVEEENHIYFRKHCNTTELACVRKLMVDADLNWNPADCPIEKMERGRGFGGISVFVFKGIEEYTVLWTEGTDPLPYWANLNMFPSVPYWHARRCSRIKPWEAYSYLKRNWNIFHRHEKRDLVAKHNCEDYRFGRFSEVQKWEPAIKRWKIPLISTLGLESWILSDFYDSNESSWAQIVMERAIEDLFMIVGLNTVDDDDGMDGVGTGSIPRTEHGALVAIEGFDARQEFAVVAAGDEDLGV
ncbi:hypothetical protein G7Y89_g14472 [Cudoniella acicularis]|uniref:2EXR domain-containing protein n=1 Tax=Cudoniella acicularis TaxID=354080 RepID=A0A8H4R1X6_9HELO|nr:hypothetical protein G7Y89_g14472 [Cudoniella acicularis]